MKTKLALVLFFILLVSYDEKVTSRNRITSNNTNPYLIEIGGQSNAHGTAPIANLQPDLTGIITGAEIFNTQTLTWQPLQGGVNNYGAAYGYYYPGVFGVELRLMKLLYQHYGVTQKLLKYSLGGTALAQDGGSPNNLDWSAYSNNRLFDQSGENFSNGAIQSNDQRTPKAFIFIQGEQDAYYSIEAANAYQANLQNFIQGKRAFYNDPEMPFIIVRLGDLQSNSLYPYKSIIRTAQQTVANQPHNYLVSADGLNAPDGSHYDAPGYDILAHRIFSALIAIDAQVLPVKLKSFQVKRKKLSK